MADYVYGNGSLAFDPQRSSYDAQQSLALSSLRNAVLGLGTSGVQIDVRGYGATGDGTTDDTAAIAAAVAAVTTTTGGRLYFPKGTYLLSSTQTFTNIQALVLEGAGQRASVLRWNGAAGSPCLKFVNCRGPTMRDMAIEGSTSGIPSALVEVQQDSAQSGVSTRGFFENVRFGGDSYGHEKCVKFSAAAVDQNNDLSTFVGCTFQNFTVAGVSIEHSQSKWHNFFNCAVSGETFRTKLNYDAQTANFTVGQVLTGGTSSHTGTIYSVTDNGTTGTIYLTNATGTFTDNETITDPLGGSATANGTLIVPCGVSTNLNSGQGGSFTWVGGGGDNMAVVFDLGAPDDAISIIGMEVEEVGRFLTVGGVTGGTGAAWPITVQGCRIACNNLHSDARLITVASPGPLNLIGNSFGEAGQTSPTIYSRGGNQKFITAIGNHWGVAGSQLTDPFSFESDGYANRLVDLGNMYFDGAQSVSRGDRIGPELTLYTMPPPSVVSAVQGTGGTLADATYSYRVTATNAAGESLPATAVTCVVTAGGGTAKVTITWKRVYGATGYKVYGRSSGAEELIYTIGSGATLSQVDDGTVAPSGAFPTGNTARESTTLATLVKAAYPAGTITSQLDAVNGRLYLGSGGAWRARILGDNGNQGMDTNGQDLDLILGCGATKAVAPARFKLPSIAKASLPAAAAGNAGWGYYVTDEAGGATWAYSDGTNWRRVYDNAVVS